MALSFVHFREKPAAPAAPVRFQFQAPPGADFGPISPNGREIALHARGRLLVYSLESGETRDLGPASSAGPIWSPDSRFIGYGLGQKLMKVEAAGGIPQVVTDIPSQCCGGAWSQDNLILFADRQVGFFRVPASGGVPVQITARRPELPEGIQFGASFLPDQRHFIYTRWTSDPATSGVYWGSVDAKPEEQDLKPQIHTNWQARYAPSDNPATGYLLFIDEGTLMAQPFDNRRLVPRGKAEAIAERIEDNNGGAGGGASFTVSTNGVLVYRHSNPDVQITWYDREGKALSTVGEPGEYVGLALSPDGKRLAALKRSGSASNIWLIDTANGVGTRFTSSSAKDLAPVWSPDGSRIVFASDRDGSYKLYEKPTNGLQNETLLLAPEGLIGPSSWSRDGRFLLYTVDDPKTKRDIWVLPMQGEKKPFPLLTTPFDELHAKFSPDGHWVSYQSNESGRSRAYLRSFSMNGASTMPEVGAARMLSNRGAHSGPYWRADGAELYLLDSSAGPTWYSIPVTSSPVLELGNPRNLGFAPGLGGWEPSPDGKRFLALPIMNASDRSNVILNWQALLKK